MPEPPPSLPWSALTGLVDNTDLDRPFLAAERA